MLKNSEAHVITRNLCYENASTSRRITEACVVKSQWNSSCSSCRAGHCAIQFSIGDACDPATLLPPPHSSPFSGSRPQLETTE
eukprot:760251-Hanusia_phi.AAC.4